MLESLGLQRGHIKDNKDNRDQTDEVEDSFRPGKDVVCRWFELIVAMFGFLGG